MKEIQLYKKDDIVSECLVIEYEGTQVSNPTIDMIHAAGWMEYTPEPHVRTLEEAKNEKINEVTAYDITSSVNEFYIGENALWIDRETRAVLVNRFAVEKAAGKTTTTLWDSQDRSYTLPIETAEQMLAAVEMYAAESYDVTAQHRAAVRQLTTIEAVDAYDHTQGYPDKLHFNIG